MRSELRCDCTPSASRIECALRALRLKERVCARETLATPRENFASDSRAIGGIRRDSAGSSGRRWRHDERRR